MLSGKLTEDAMAERLSYERFLEFEKIMQSAIGRRRIAKAAALDGIKHVKISTERGNHEEARLYVEGIMESFANA